MIVIGAPNCQNKAVNSVDPICLYEESELKTILCIHQF